MVKKHKWSVCLVWCMVFALLMAGVAAIRPTRAEGEDPAPVETYGNPYSYKVATGEPVTYNPDGSITTTLGPAVGITSQVANDVRKPFKISYKQADTNWYGAAIFPKQNAEGTFGLSFQMHVPGVVLGETAIKWAGDYTKAVNVQYIPGGIEGFFNIPDYVKPEAAEDPQVQVQKLLDGSGVNTRAKNQTVEMIFDIRDEIGLAWDQATGVISKANSGSNVRIRTIAGDGTATEWASFGLTATRADFPDNTAYFCLAGSDSGSETVVRQSEAYQIIDSTPNSAIEDLKVNGTAFVPGETSIFAGDSVSFKLADVEDGMTVVLGEKALAADANGVYSGTMPFGNVEVKVMSGTSQLYAVTFDLQGGKGDIAAQTVTQGELAERPKAEPSRKGNFFGGWYSDAECTTEFDFAAPIETTTVVYAKWNETVIVTYELPFFNTVTEEILKGTNASEKILSDIHAQKTNPHYVDYLGVDSLELNWYTDAARTQKFDFAGDVNAATKLYGELKEVKKYANPGVYGWDVPNNFKDEQSNPFIDENCIKTPVLSEDGISEFNFPIATSAAVYSRGLDVTKPIHVKMNFNGYVEGIGSWISFSLHDKLTLAQLAYSSGYTQNFGSIVGFGWDGVTGAALKGDNIVTKWDVDNVYGDGAFQLDMTIVFGQTAADSVIKIGNTVAAHIDAAQSDFQDGYAYITVGTFKSCGMMAMVYQDEIDVTAGTCENGSLTVEKVAGGGINAKVVPAEGYKLTSFYVNGEEVDFEQNDDGTYAIFYKNFETMEVTASFKKENKPIVDEEDEKKESGCGGCGAITLGGTGGMMGGLLLLAAAGLFLIQRSKKNRS